MIALREREPLRMLDPELRVTSVAPSELARERMRARWGEPLFLADWMRVLMIHFEVDARTLQRDVPYPLELLDGRAFVTLVAFTMEHMRPRIGGKFGAWWFKPIATHDFLNVRTYVRHHGEPGIHFLAEWLSSWLAVQLGPRTFGLPYRHGRICYEHNRHNGTLHGRVVDVKSKAAFAYKTTINPQALLAPSARGSQDEWLMERYTAFNAVNQRKRFFRVWHPPWPQCRITVSVAERSLLEENWPWFASAAVAGAVYSPGVRAVWMGRPHRAGAADSDLLLAAEERELDG